MQTLNSNVELLKKAIDDAKSSASDIYCDIEDYNSIEYHLSGIIFRHLKLIEECCKDLDKAINKK